MTKTIYVAHENPSEKWMIHLIPQSHIDLAWCWRWSDTVKMIYDTLEGHASILEKNPEATYAQSQVHIYWTTERLFPDLFGRIKGLVSEGRWEIVGGEWVESDHLLPSGESLVRQLLTGQNYLREKFGKQAKIGWSPDAFGHTPNLPQVMLKCCLQAFVFKRPREKFMKLPEVPFWWVGLDGSKILSLRVSNKGIGPRRGIPQVSEGRILPEGMNEITYLQNEFGRYRVHHLWGTIGTGDVGGVNQYLETTSGKNWRMIYSTPSRFVEQVRKEAIDLPEIEGELGGIFAGTYTTHIDMKEGNRKAESQLFLTEFLGSLAMIFGQPYPEEKIKEAWRRFLFNHFHDIIGGTSIPEVHVESRHDFFELFRTCEDLQRRSLWFLVEKIDTRGPGKPIIVFNALNWERTDLVEVEIDGVDNAESLEIVDADGTVPVQILEERKFQKWRRQRILFVASNVPPLGYKVMWLKPAQKEDKNRSIYRNVAENEFFKIVADPRTGYLYSIFDKRLNREIIGPAGKVACRWLIFEEGYYIQDYNKDMKAWNLGLTGKAYEAEKTAVPTLVEVGPLRITLALRHKFGSSSFEQDVHIHRGLPRIDVTVRVRWEEAEKLARLEFPFDLNTAKLVAEVPFGAIPRPTDGTEFPAQRWVDMSDEKWGVAILNNARYGHNADRSHVRISVLRCSTQPDPRSDQGEYEFRYAIYPHSGSWAEASVHRRGCEFNIPLVGVEATIHEGDLPPHFSLASIESPQLIVSSLKKTEEGDELVLRLYEATGSSAVSRMKFADKSSVSNLKETNLIEDPILTLDAVNGEFEIEFSPFEIKTFRIVRSILAETKK